MTSLRGNLNTVDLANIFQMLQMNQREGTLYISGSEGRKAIYFDPEGVTTLGRSRRRHGVLGRILVRQGLVTDEQLADAARRQSKGSGRLIGQILVEQGLVRREQIEDALRLQTEEEIYDLFIDRDAHFEFVEGPIPAEFSDGGGLTRVAINVNGVIMEAAQRIDEWDWIRDVVPDPREIFRYTGRNVDLEDPIFAEPAAGRVLTAIDGRRDVEDLIESTFVGRFEVCKVLALLIQGEALEPVPPDVLRREADAALAARDNAAAIKYLARLVELRSEAPETHRQLAEAYESERELERAAFHYRVYAEIRADGGDVKSAFHVYRRIYEMLATDLAAAERMVELFAQNSTGIEDAAREVLTVGRMLADVFIELGRTSRAIQVLHRVVALSPDDADLRTRLVDVYLSAGMTGEAVAEYQALAEAALAMDDHARAERILRKILTIDASRTDVLRHLNQITSRRARRRRSVRNSIAAAGLLTLLGVGGWHGAQMWFEKRAEVERANARTSALVAELRDQQASLAGELAAAVRSLAGNRGDDLSLHAALEEGRQARADMERRSSKAIGDLMAVIEQHPGTSAAEEAQEVAGGLRSQLRELRRLEGEAVKRLATSSQKLYMHARGLVEREAPTREQYAAFDAAMRYSELCTDWLASPDGTDCQAFHKSLRETLDALDATQRDVRSLTAEGRVEQAFERAVTFLQQYPPPDVANEVLFPVQVVSRPSGARISVAGVEVEQRTPTTVLLPLRAGCEIELFADGFAPTPVMVPAAAESDPRRIAAYLPRRLDTALQREARFVSVPLKGRLEAPAECSNGLLLVPTRGDECAVLDVASGDVSVSLPLRNPNGAVTQPVVVDGTVATATVDGRIYFHDLSRRRLIGAYDAPGGLRLDPVAHAGTVIAVTDAGYVVAVDVASQRERWRHPAHGRSGLAAPAVAPPLLSDGRFVVVTADGLVTELDALTGRRVREVRVTLPAGATGLLQGAARRGDDLYAFASDGRLLRIDLRTGAILWGTALSGRPAGAPLPAGDAVLAVAEDGSVFVVASADGAVASTASLPGAPGAAPVLDGDLLLAVVEGGRMVAIEHRDGELSPRWEYAARALDGSSVRLTTRPVVRDAVVLVGGDDGRVRAIQR